MKSETKKGKTLRFSLKFMTLVLKGDIPDNRLGNIISVSTPFVCSGLPIDQFKFVIYDTPGSGSVWYREHTEVLKESLEQQTNGLPIVITTPDSMDNEANEKLMKIIGELAASLDRSNMMLIVNKSDEKGKDELAKKNQNKDKLALTKCRANRTYFVSSILGLGAKKNNSDEWISDSYREKFYSYKDKMSDPKHPYYVKLYDYNILPEDAKKRIAERTEYLDDSSDASERLLWNSGIRCVEEEIGIFAQEKALYNKCLNAISYLKEAVERVNEDVLSAEKEAEKLRKEIDTNLESEKQSLIERLKRTCDKKRKKFSKNHSDILRDRQYKYIEKKRVKAIVNNVYDRSRGKNDHEKLKDFNEGIESELRKDIYNYSQETSDAIRNNWKKCAEELCDDLMKIVVDCQTLTLEQKYVLKSVVLKTANLPSEHKELNIIKNSDVVLFDVRFLGFLFYMTYINKSEAVKKYKESLWNDLQSNGKNAAIENEKEVSEWIDRLLNELDMTIASFNPRLRQLERDLRSWTDEVNQKKNQGAVLQAAMNEMKYMLNFK